MNTGTHPVESAAVLLGRSNFRTNGRNGKSVLFYITRLVQIRTFRQLLILFDNSDYSIYVGASHWRWLISLARSLRWHKGVRLLWRYSHHTKVAVLFTDRESDPSDDPCTAAKVINVKYDYRPGMKLARGNFAMPLSMHQQLFVQFHEPEKLDPYRAAKRTIRIFFAGNISKQYSNPWYSKSYPVLTRQQILDFLKDKGLARTVSTNKQLEKVLREDHVNEFVLIEPGARVHQSKWLSLLARADFFLSPPGLDPWSHNSVEAMAVGTIPLLNYPDWFYPPLKHMVNCITFSGFEDLEARLRDIQKMPRSAINALRSRVIEYYERHLSPRLFADRLLSSPERCVTLHTWGEKTP